MVLHDDPQFGQFASQRIRSREVFGGAGGGALIHERFDGRVGGGNISSLEVEVGGSGVPKADAEQRVEGRCESVQLAIGDSIVS
ncbi:MAG TPA: hypothetical protein VMU64_13270 [Acidimicrobiales bacterium]|nr:hypothetical protein [Acidimicrobiales bacterium]